MRHTRKEGLAATLDTTRSFLHLIDQWVSCEPHDRRYVDIGRVRLGSTHLRDAIDGQTEWRSEWNVSYLTLLNAVNRALQQAEMSECSRYPAKDYLTFFPKDI